MDLVDRTFPPFRKGIGPKKKLILLLSTGDVCRSPMAAGYLRKLLNDRKITTVEVRPAGVLTVPGLRATQETIQIMESEGIDLSRHQSCQLSSELIRKCDLILGMTPLHVQEALKISKDAKSKSFLLKEFAKSDLKNIQIPDPMGTTLEYYKKCFKEIKAACEGLVDLEFFGGSRKARVVSVVDVPVKAKSPARTPRAAMTATPRAAEKAPAPAAKTAPPSVAAKPAPAPAAKAAAKPAPAPAPALKAKPAVKAVAKPAPAPALKAKPAVKAVAKPAPASAVKAKPAVKAVAQAAPAAKKSAPAKATPAPKAKAAPAKPKSKK